MTDKVDAPKSVNAVATALCPSISELQGRHSQRQMALRFPRSPKISDCQVSDCHYKPIDEKKDNEKKYQTDKRFLIHCQIVKFRMTALKSPVFCSMYFLFFS